MTPTASTHQRTEEQPSPLMPLPTGSSVPEDPDDHSVGVIPATTEHNRPYKPQDATDPERDDQAAVMRPLPPALWDDPNVAEALTTRDIAQLFRFLQERGVPQRRIAAHTGQSQSEISEILNGRTVTSYPVLERIALGLGIPRGRLGLAYEDSPQPLNAHGDGSPPSVSIPTRVRPTRQRGADLTPEAPGVGEDQPTVDNDFDAVLRALLAAGLVEVDSKPLTTVALWSGVHVRALREAIRKSVREFAKYLGVSDRMVSKWEAEGAKIQPRPVNQCALDTCLDRLSDEERQRFTRLVHATVGAGKYMTAVAATNTRQRRRPQSSSPRDNPQPEGATPIRPATLPT